MGICISGIFVITGQGAQSAGPAVSLSFFIAAMCCLCSAFAYAEFAARVPVSGTCVFVCVCVCVCVCMCAPSPCG
jgi:amino acid transporter